MTTLYEEPPLILDFESRSNADLEEVGGRLYWEDPSTEPICLCMYYMGERLTWLPGDPPPGEFRVIASLGMFDRWGWEDWLGWPAPELWVDLQAQARKAGLKAGLDALASRLLGESKDKEGSKLAVALSRHKVSKWADIPEDCRAELKDYYAQRKAQPELWPMLDDYPTILSRVVEYCGTDVDQTARLYEQTLYQWIDTDADVERVDRIINDRGICFDRDLAAALLGIDERAAEAACTALGVTAKELRSNDQFPELVLLAGGPQIPNCQFATVEELTRYRTEGARPEPRAETDEMDAVVRALAEARISLASIAKGKLTAGLARTSADGRMRDAHKYIGAHTWRWAGQGLQPQNIPWIDRRAT